MVPCVRLFFLLKVRLTVISGVWDTGAVEGPILVAALDADLTLEPGDVVAEVRAGCADSTVCGCGSLEIFFTSVESAPVCESCGVGIPGGSTCGQLQGRGEHSSCMDTRTTPCYHIVESWDIEKMMEEPPTDEYYDLLRKDMGHRHPKACPHLLDHRVSVVALPC